MESQGYGFARASTSSVAESRHFLCAYRPFRLGALRRRRTAARLMKISHQTMPPIMPPIMAEANLLCTGRAAIPAVAAPAMKMK